MFLGTTKNIRKCTLLILTIIAFLLVTEINEADSLAASSFKYEDVLETVCVGAAEDLETDILPTTEEVEKIIADNAWKNPGALVMAACNNSVNVRSEANEQSEKSGKLYSDCGGYIIEYTEDWTKIQSGELIGWVSNQYLMFGDEAKAKAEEVGSTRASITTDGVNIRCEDNTDSEVLDQAVCGDVFDVIDENDEWVVIDYEGTTGYVRKDFANVEFVIDFGETIEEINAREQAEKEAQAKLLAEKREAERKQYYGVYAANASDVEILAALIQCEAGNQPYEGQVAVGAVVMNRVRSAAYPNTIYGVIYASGQFTPAGTGAVDRRIANGISPQCLQAATDAINGYSPVGPAMHFRPTGRHDGIVIGGHVFW